MRRLLLPAILLAFLAITLPFLARPGLEYDEAYFINPALVTWSGSAEPPHDFVHQTISIGGHTLPIRTFPYIGALKAWLFAPIFGLAGVSMTSIRLPAVLLALLTIVLLWRAARTALGRGAGALATALFALDPGYLFNARCDTGPLVLAVLCGVSALMLLQRALARQSALCLFAACSVIALGFFDKLTFAWNVSGLLSAAVVVYWRDLLVILRGRGCVWAWLGVGLCSLCYAVFAWMMLRGNRSLVGLPGIAKLHALWDGLAGEGLLHEFQTGAVWQRSGFLQTLAYDPDRLRLHEQGQVEPEWLAWFTRLDVLHGTLMPALLLAALLLLPWALRRVDAAQRRVGVFVAVACVVNYGLLFVARGTGLPHHFPLPFPYPQLLIAFVVVNLRPARALRMSVVGLQFALCLLVCGRTIATYVHDGGNGAWSDASVTLVRQIEQQGQRPVFLDWGMQQQWIAFAGRTRPSTEIAFDPIGASGEVDARERERGSAALRGQIEQALDRRAESVFVTWDERWQWHPSLDLLRTAAAARGVRVEPGGLITQRDGRPLFHLWRAR